ncbi:hypothetical protein NDA11_004564 [Ustilago hordei]|uniref:Uncharacterized protein n=1 Tax=Ustilago hordei TaxID=120017 RepID=I2FMM7_USTHO|nr:uncharacterized protein UHO2_06164 [Ustilago hordei]KAJ1037835.1 hypothetical protein NDA10_000986 [Ustilago hordei]KAJ1574926.1 hypothetical protein NDA15_001597 [Ustilago hordei]KAJ1594000.1 hypothetical protein NDA12_002411 [Ustilago hordei]KAJ1594780.1 hypothetical protein NDA11_004564 [Ustilago hordei]KAJ1597634.1 hypothetical protein NDA14_006653 [Ustilago hordei]
MAITNKWKITDNGPAKEFLKIKITHDCQSQMISLNQPSPEAMQAALKVVKYLNQTKDEVLSLGNSKANVSPIVTYTDANWASDPNTD